VPVVDALEKLESLVPPFRVSVRGAALDVGDVMPASSGQAMRAFKLVDGKGRYVMVRQLVSGANDVSIRNGALLNMYYLSAKIGWRAGEAGSLWAYENSYTTSEGVSSALPKASREVVISGGAAMAAAPQTWHG